MWLAPETAVRRMHKKRENMKRSRFGRWLGLLLVVCLVDVGASACGWSREEAVLLQGAAEAGTPETPGTSETLGTPDPPGTPEALETPERAGVSDAAEHSEAFSGEDVKAADDGPAEPEKIVVFVCGAVCREGVYELPDGARVYEAVEAAGGFSDDAERSWINQALVLRDADELRVPTREEAEEWRSQKKGASGGDPGGVCGLPGGGAAGRQGVSPGVRGASEEGSPAACGDGAGGRVNLNTADAAQLMTIPGIGETKAEAILDYREQNGLFHSAEEVMKIRGIKAGLFERMKPYITVE